MGIWGRNKGKIWDEIEKYVLRLLCYEVILGVRIGFNNPSNVEAILCRVHKYVLIYKKSISVKQIYIFCKLKRDTSGD